MAKYGIRLYWLSLATVFAVHVSLTYFNPFLFEKILVDKTERLSIESGMSALQIANVVYEKQYIRSKFWFLMYVYYHHSPRVLKAGVYEIDSNFTPASLADNIAEGQIVEEKITIVEGYDFSDLYRTIKAHEHIELKILNESKSVVAEKLGIPESFLDGAFLPETYFYSPGDSDLKILRRAHQSLIDYYQEQVRLLKHKPLLDDMIQVLSLASIIGRESRLSEEKGLIASVFYNRLEKNMLLQSDATVIYALGDIYQGDIKREHLSYKHPYNTYTTKGLPPYPIAYADKESIKAALNPVLSDYLYFVATGKDDKHYFSENYSEHKEAVKRYLESQSKP